MSNLFSKTFRLVIPLIIIVEAISLTGYTYGIVDTIGFWLLLAVALFLTWKNGLFLWALQSLLFSLWST